MRPKESEPYPLALAIVWAPMEEPGKPVPSLQHPLPKKARVLPSLKLTARPQEWWFTIGISFSRDLFQGRLLFVSGMVFLHPWQV